MGEATTTIGPLTKKARPVAVSVRRPAVSRMRGSVTVIPLTVIGVYDCAAFVSSSSVSVTVMPRSPLAVGDADDGARVALRGEVGLARTVSVGPKLPIDAMGIRCSARLATRRAMW